MLDVFPQFPLVEVLEDGVGALIEGALEQHGAQHDGEGESGGAAEERAVRRTWDFNDRMQKELLGFK